MREWWEVNCFMHFVLNNDSKVELKTCIQLGTSEHICSIIRAYLQTHRKDLRWRLWLVCQRWSCQWKGGNWLVSVWIQSGRSGLLWFGVVSHQLITLLLFNNERQKLNQNKWQILKRAILSLNNLNFDLFLI